jgi:hypothetical protein
MVALKSMSGDRVEELDEDEVPPKKEKEQPCLLI